MTKLHTAVKKSCLDTVRLPLESGTTANYVNIIPADLNGNTSLHLAFSNKSYGIIDLLLSAPDIANSNPTNNQGLSHFHIACTRNNVNVVKNFIENGVNLDTCVGRNSNLGNYSPLHFAVSHNRSKIVKLLLNNGASAGVKDNKGFTPLHLACYYTSDMFSEVITNIISNSSVHEQISKQCYSSIDTEKLERKIYWSQNRKDHLEILNLLLNSNESDLNSSDRWGNTPIFYACSAVHDLNYRLLNNRFGCSEDLWAEIVASLIYEELYERRKLILNYLVKLDVNLDKCYNNNSILYYICKDDDKYSDELMALFLRKGANPNVENEEKLTPLILASRNRKEILMRTLLNHGANVNCIDPLDNSTPLMIIASISKLIGDADIFQMLILMGENVNARKSDGRTALHILASIDEVRNFSSMISDLTKAGADINSQDLNGLTALHIACERSNFEAIILLLKYGADVNVEDNKGRSVCCYFYEENLTNLTYEELDKKTKLTMEVLQNFVIKMNILRLPVSEKVFLAYSKFNTIHPLDDNKKIRVVVQCQREVLLLKGTRIHDRCTLYDVIFRNENAMSQLVKNPVFQSIVKADSFNNEYPHYNCYIKLKYEAGLIRGELLPKAKLVLNKIAKIHLPHTCSENICKYFTNHELKDSIANLDAVLDMNLNNTGNNRLIKSSSNKRQKTD